MESKLKIKSVQYNFIMNIVLRMSAFIFPMITFPYTSRVLLAEGNGKIAFAVAVVNYFVLFASLGLPTYGVKACSQVRDDKTKLSRCVHELLSINVISMCISYISFAILMIVVPEFQKNSLLLWINSASIILSVAGIEWFYQAIEQYDYITIRNILIKLISIILMFLFVKNKDDYIIYGLITILGTVGSNIWNIVKLPSYIMLKNVGDYCLKKHLKPIIFLFLYSAATTIYTNLDTVMLGFMVNEEEVGYYNAAVKLKNILVSVVTALGAVLMPRVTYYLNNGKQEEFNNLIQKSFEFIFVLSVPMSIYFMFESSTVINFLAGSGYEQAIPTMKIIMPSLIFIGIGSVTAWQLLIPFNKEHVTVIGAIIGGVINLIINFILIPSYGATGAAFATVIAEILVVISHYIGLKTYLKNINIRIELVKIICATLISLAVYLLSLNWLFVDMLLIRLIVTSIIFFASYGILLLIFKENIANQIFSSILHKLKR